MSRILAALLGLMIAFPSMAAEIDGLVKKPSPYSVGETLDRLATVLEKKGIKVALRWDHGGNAQNVDIPLRDTQLLIFGNPALGSHLMTATQSAGIDLPMKALAWRDADGKVWLAYNDPAYIAERHHITGRDDILGKMSGALDKLSDAALASD